jgi:hypothetical protein
MRLALLHPSLALLIAACAAAATPLPDDAVILPESQAAALLHQCSRPTPPPGETSWQPGAADIAALEAALPSALRPRPEIHGLRYGTEPDWTRVPVGWRRQYVGIVRRGRHYIYGAFYPRSFDEGRPFPSNWRTEAVNICDGGPPVFGAEYDVQGRRFTHFAFNFEA